MGAVSTGLPVRYASLALNQLALDMVSFNNLKYNDTITCTKEDKKTFCDYESNQECLGLCRYSDGKTYLEERFAKDTENRSQVLNVDLNLLI